MTTLEDLRAKKFVEFKYTRAPQSNIVDTLWAVVTSPDTGKKLIEEFPGLGASVSGTDFTHGTSTSNLQVGSIVCFNADAGGFPIPAVYFVYLAGAGIEGEKTEVRGRVGHRC